MNNIYFSTSTNILYFVYIVDVIIEILIVFNPPMLSLTIR